MIAIATPDAGTSRPSLASTLRAGVPRAYSSIFFSSSAELGWYFIAVTMLVPRMGIAGLAGVVLACALGWWLGFEPAHLRSGYLLFNPMLACMTVAWLHGAYHYPNGVFFALWFGAALAALVLSVGTHAFFAIHFGLSAHSLPAVVVSYVLYFLSSALYGAFDILANSQPPQFELAFLPDFLRTLGQAFGAMLFMPLTLPGLLIFAGLLVVSRLTTVAAVVGLAAGTGTMALFDLPLDPNNILWCGFNFLLCGTALGTGYYTPSRSSLLVAALAAFFCAPVALALVTALRYFALPASALPANLVILSLVYALKQRRTATALLPNLHPARGPEISARLRLISEARFPLLGTPALRIPCNAPRVVTQGFDGALTHRGPWRHALDFEAQEAGRTYSGDGATLDQFFMYNTPVLAPCDGVVARVVQTVPDNQPGQNNPDNNWGNLVIIYADAGFYVKLAHLKNDSVKVSEGQRVTQGEPIGMTGNSGRSPVPHLHLQVQDSPQPGANTRPFCLTHYISTTPDKPTPQYETAAVPASGQIVQAPLADPRFAACLNGWLPGEYRYRITAEMGRSWEETLVVDFDEAGYFRIQSRRHRASLRAFVKAEVFYCTDFNGPGESILALIAAGLARVPYIADPDVSWRDKVSAVPFLPAVSRWLHNTLDPFVGPSLLDYSYRFGPGAIPTIECELANSSCSHDPQVPCHIVTCLIPKHAIASMQVRFGDARILAVEMINYRINESPSA